MQLSCSRLFTRAITAALFAAPPSLAQHASTYPTRPIRMLVPFAAGGGTDIMGRAIAARYTEAWGQPVIVDNRAEIGRAHV